MYRDDTAECETLGNSVGTGASVPGVPVTPGAARERPAGGPGAYIGAVPGRRSVVDYSLQRRAVLAEVYAGRTGLFEVCDASPYLSRAAKYHGEATSVACPVCRKERLTLANYVYGDHLGPTSGQAK